MNTGQILLSIYLVSIIIWLLIFIIKKNRVKHSTNRKLEIVFSIISILLAPIVLIIGLITIIDDKRKKDRPLPVPKKLRGYLKKDTVMFNGRTMSLQEVNRITGKNYTLEQIYGK